MGLIGIYHFLRKRRRNSANTLATEAGFVIRANHLQSDDQLEPYGAILRYHRRMGKTAGRVADQD